MTEQEQSLEYYRNAEFAAELFLSVELWVDSQIRGFFAAMKQLQHPSINLDAIELECWDDKNGVFYDRTVYVVEYEPALYNEDIAPKIVDILIEIGYNAYLCHKRGIFGIILG